MLCNLYVNVHVCTSATVRIFARPTLSIALSICGVSECSALGRVMFDLDVCVCECDTDRKRILKMVCKCIWMNTCDWIE